MAELREKIAKKLNKENGIKAKKDNIIITSGTSGGINLALSVLLDQGDEVILPDPYFVIYPQALKFLGAKIKYLNTYPDFQISPEKLEKIITPKTKLLILNSPNNPTGAIYGKESLKNITEIARKNNIIILSDEIYEKFDYDNKFFSIGSIYEKTITLNGFSKSMGLAGWRVGYAHGPIDIIEAMNAWQQYTFVCAPAPMQKAIYDNFDIDLSGEYENYKKKRDFVYKNLSFKYEIAKPEGAFYAFLKIPGKEDIFLKKLFKKGVLAVPGSVFSQKSGWLRLSFAVEDDILEKAVEVLSEIKNK